MKNKWKNPDVPKIGWVAVGICDMGSDGPQCYLCGNRLRYVHELKHSAYENIKVGCECAMYLITGYRGHELQKQFIEDEKRKIVEFEEKIRIEAIERKREAARIEFEKQQQERAEWIKNHPEEYAEEQRRIHNRSVAMQLFKDF